MSPTALQHTGLHTETYRGVKIRTKPGRGQDWGYTHLEVNGHNHGRQMDSEERVLASTRGTVDDAIERPEAYDDHWQPGHKGVKDPSAWQGHRCARRVLAKDQTVVPEKVDTMREEICPVCGSDDSYVGDKCTVCGFEKPPKIFMDPDTSLAQNVDLRQEDQEDANDDGAGDLQCPNCGQTFPSAESLNQAGDPHLAPAAQTIPAEQDLEAPEEGDVVPPGEQVPADEAPPPGPEDEEEAEEEELPPGQEDNQMAPPPPVGAGEAPEEDEQPEPPEAGEEEEEEPEGALPAPGEEEEDDEDRADTGAISEPPEQEVPEGAEPEASPEEMAEEQYATDEAAMAQTGYEEGDICPNCGQGLLQDIGISDAVPSPGNPPEVSEDMPQGAPPIAPERADTEPDEEAGEEAAEEEEEAEEEGLAPPAAEDEAEEAAEEDQPGAEGEEEDEEEGDDDDDNGPPWLKKKTSSNELALGRSPSTMPNPTRPNRRTTPRQAAQAPAAAATPRSSVRTALHASLNRQAQVLRQMTAACHQERMLRLAAEARIETLERQMLRFAQIAGADTDPELRHINEVGYRTHASLMAKAASLHVADARDPAQPVPEPGAEPPVVTEQQAAQPAARDDVTQLGATPVTDVSADATVAVDQPYGTEAFEPLNLNEVDVTAPVQNTQGHLPPEQTIIPVEVRVGDPDDPQPSFGWTLDGNGAPQGQTGGSVGSGAPTATGGGSPPGVMPGTRASRNDGQVSLGALRLARLRIQAGIAPPGYDDIAIAASIQDNPDMSVEAVNTEIKTLTQVLSVPQQGRVANANRRLVPRSANPTSEAPSLAVASEPGPIRAHASTGAVSPDEMLFE